MKLHKVPRGTWIRITDADWEWEDEFFFEKLDGSFSICRDEYGHMLHLNHSTEVEVMDEQPDAPRHKEG